MRSRQRYLIHDRAFMSVKSLMPAQPKRYSARRAFQKAGQRVNQSAVPVDRDFIRAVITLLGDAISAEDFAVAIVDELEKPAHTGTRFTVAN
jgi:hypothetical protein